MGACGLGLFESDHDLDIVLELDCDSRLLMHDVAIRILQKIKIVRRLLKEAGFGETAIDQAAEEEENADGKKLDEKPDILEKLRKAAAVEVEAAISQMRQGLLVQDADLFPVRRGEDAEQAFTRHEFHHSMYAKECSCPARVRRLLEEEPNLITGGQSMVKELIEKYEKKLEGEQMLRNPYGAGYKTVVLGACFMSLGCTLTDSFRSTLKRIYPEVGLMRNAQEQMKKALGDGPEAYKNGQPYDFGSRGCDEIQRSGGCRVEDIMHPNSPLFNCPAPNDFAPAQALGRLDDGLKKRLREEMNTIKAISGEELLNCAHCSATHGADNAALLHCGRCGRARYCSSECQRSDWVTHKIFCATLARGLGNDRIFIGNCHPFLAKPGWKDRLSKQDPADLENTRRTDPVAAHFMDQAQLELEKGEKRDSRGTKRLPVGSRP